MLSAAGVSAADAVIDVGGGASPLTGALLDRGFGDLTVLDLSAAGIQHARDRLGPRADGHVSESGYGHCPRGHGRSSRTGPKLAGVNQLTAPGYRSCAARCCQPLTGPARVRSTR